MNYGVGKFAFPLSQYPYPTRSTDIGHGSDPLSNKLPRFVFLSIFRYREKEALYRLQSIQNRDQLATLIHILRDAGNRIFKPLAGNSPGL